VYAFFERWNGRGPPGGAGAPQDFQAPIIVPVVHDVPQQVQLSTVGNGLEEVSRHHPHPAPERYLSDYLTIFPIATILKHMPNHPGELDRVFRALSDPSRRSMVERLARGPASVSQLAEPFDMSLAAVVQHLGVLEEAGIVVSEKVGRVRTCRLETGGLRQAEDWLGGQRTAWERRLDRLGDALAEPDDRNKQ